MEERNTSMEQETIKCPNCGAENSLNNVFCENCGTRLQDKTLENVAIDQTLFCPACGAKYNEGDIFCRACGAKLKNIEACTIKTDKEEVSRITYKHEKISNTDTSSTEDTVTCPYCGSSIQRYTKKCPHCGEWLKGGVSHFGCGGFMMILATILAICIALGSESISIPILGEVGGLVLVIIAFLYFLPSLIADLRGHDSKLAIFIVNLLFGWTFIGWFIALIFSFTGRSR